MIGVIAARPPTAPLSSTKVFQPIRDPYIADAIPAGPAPTIIMSKSGLVPKGVYTPSKRLFNLLYTFVIFHILLIFRENLKEKI